MARLETEALEKLLDIADKYKFPNAAFFGFLIETCMKASGC